MSAGCDERASKGGGDLPPSVNAAYEYVESMIDRRDAAAGNAPLWHGWALRDAFCAGVIWAENHPGEK